MPTARKKGPRNRPVVLTGESALVSELGMAFASAGIPVLYRLNPGEPAIPPSPGMKKSASPPGSVLLGVELTNTDREQKRRNLKVLDTSMRPETLILTSSVTVTAAVQASWIRRPERLLGMSALPTLLCGKLIELSPHGRTGREAVSEARDILAMLGKEVSVVQDRIGMVMPRILTMLVNEAAFALTEEIASPSDIDTAMKLGTGYPSGPVEWCGKIGVRQVVSVLRALRDDLGEERYRIAPLLQMMDTAVVTGGT